MAKNKDVLVFEGVVAHSCKGNFIVLSKTNEGERKINATPSGKLRQNQIEVLVGDKVTVECSPHDPTRGRVIFRLNK